MQHPFRGDVSFFSRCAAAPISGYSDSDIRAAKSNDDITPAQFYLGALVASLSQHALPGCFFKNSVTCFGMDIAVELSHEFSTMR